MNLLSNLGIRHSVLYDGDEGKEYQKIVNDFIQSLKTDHTYKIDFFEKDLESFLGIELPKRSDQKPVNALLSLTSGKITTEKLDALKTKIESLI